MIRRFSQFHSPAFTVSLSPSSHTRIAIFRRKTLVPFSILFQIFPFFPPLSNILPPQWSLLHSDSVGVHRPLPMAPPQPVGQPRQADSDHLALNDNSFRFPLLLSAIAVHPRRYPSTQVGVFRRLARSHSRLTHSPRTRLVEILHSPVSPTASFTTGCPIATAAVLPPPLIGQEN